MIDRRRFLGTTAGLGAITLAGCEQSNDSISGGFRGIDVARGHAWRDGALALPGGSVRHARTRVVIAGGGVAGLAAARALRLSGVEDFALLEMEDSPGGNSRGGAVNGLPCPLGAHYLPVPGDDAPEVQDLLEELGLRRRVAGRWRYDERHLCHSPQERLFFRGHWQDGLLPREGVEAATLEQYRRFEQLVETWRRRARFVIPVGSALPSADQLALDARSFDDWLSEQGLDDPHLRWYLDYCCRDDYGAGSSVVSAWAGIHYFASRHGFHAPGSASAASDEAEQDAVLTWAEGNGWLARRLAEPLGERLRTGQVVLRIADTRSGVEVDAFDVKTRQTVRWQAERCVVALPVFVAARVVESPPELLRQAATAMGHAPWLVANIHLRAPLADRSHGAAPSWDNVVYGTAGLGYVDAGHQRLDPTPRATVISWYRPLGPSRHDGGDGRQRLLERPWTGWRDDLLSELQAAHPDLRDVATRIEITRYGHAMAIPTPGLLERLGAGRRRITHGSLAFAHADWSGYSIFEEAFCRGHWAAQV
ncbi:FAD-dependent oxidoreductase [Variovorax dokdonensis]|uniref:FAD-dependent oxidoreductase n=1 Tax=Variovorax dokdonensis TaxID=344883 RepID=A0ABT7N9F5_9BURK|nr:FAD-dependent oxidoreductase [Variovorax dokdonensis]MDM0044580.1 FAD-dependent oxidoreductase [Variovorax dokdonensis]